MSIKEVLTNIADCMRALTGTTNKITLAEMTDKVVEVYSCGKELGTDEGKQSEYDRFWDSYLNYGNASYMPYMFAGGGWNNNTFKPKYDLKPVGVLNGMFRQTAFLDVKQRLMDCGKVLDLSKATGTFTGAFGYGKITALPKLDFSGATTLTQTFSSDTYLKEIEEMVVTENVTYSQAFNGCTSLVYIRISGTIGSNFDIHWSPLDKESILSIYNHSSITKTFTVTFNLNAVNKAFETSEGANDGSTSDEWKTLINNKPSGVTISLLNA